MIPETYVTARQRHWYKDKTVRLALGAFGGNVMALAYDVVSRVPDNAHVSQAFQSVTLKEWLNIVVWGIVCITAIFWGGDSIKSPIK